MSFEILRAVKIEDYEYQEKGWKRTAKVVHFEVRFTKRRTIKEWWRGEKAKSWIETIPYFTATGHGWKDFPSLRDTDIMEWKRLTELYEQLQIQQSLKKA